MSIPQSRAPLIVAIVLLLLPVLYVGSYLAMIEPHDPWRDYRFGGKYTEWFYWPVEQVDRKLRPEFWNPTNPPPVPSPRQAF